MNNQMKERVYLITNLQVDALFHLEMIKMKEDKQLIS